MTTPKSVAAALETVKALPHPDQWGEGDVVSLLDRVFPPAECDDADPAVQRWLRLPNAPVAAHTLDRDRDEAPDVIRDSEPRRWPLHHRYGVRSVA